MSGHHLEGLDEPTKPCMNKECDRVIALDLLFCCETCYWAELHGHELTEDGGEHSHSERCIERNDARQELLVPWEDLFK